MIDKKTIKQLRKDCLNQSIFSSEIMTWITQENLWNLWVPKTYGGLEKNLDEGLKILQNLAKTDGSLGWTITLCSGANYFIGNLQPSMTKQIFNQKLSPILGGSGGLFGTAEKTNQGYIINGKWRYATGAPYLSHFTLNAKLTKAGVPLKNKDGSDQFLSFILPKSQVEIIDDWQTMGMKPTATQSFYVNRILAKPEQSFQYNKCRLSQDIFKIPFALFADLTTWVNYLGMLEHYAEEASIYLNKNKLEALTSIIIKTDTMIYQSAEFIIKQIKSASSISDDYQKEVHQTAVDLIKQASQSLIELHPSLGIKACSENHQINQIFKDYFTATQHKIFAER